MRKQKYGNSWKRKIERRKRFDEKKELKKMSVLHREELQRRRTIRRCRTGHHMILCGFII